MSHRILLELVNISNPSFEKGQESSVCVSDVVWKMDKIILLDCSMFFQTQCANLNVVIFKKKSKQTSLDMFFPMKKCLSQAYKEIWGRRQQTKSEQA